MKSGTVNLKRLFNKKRFQAAEKNSRISQNLINRAAALELKREREQCVSFECVDIYQFECLTLLSNSVGSIFLLFFSKLNNLFKIL